MFHKARADGLSHQNDSRGIAVPSHAPADRHEAPQRNSIR